MKNKKSFSFKYLLSLVSTIVASSCFVSTAILINNNSNNLTSKNNCCDKQATPSNELWASASSFFTNTDVEGQIEYIYSGTGTDTEVIITGYDGDFKVKNPTFKNSVVLPTIGQCSNISFNQSAFASCDKMSGKITFSSAIKIVSQHTFESCVNLTEADFTNAINLSFLPSFAFNGCNNLTAVNFPNNQTFYEIATECFEQTNLTSISIPSTVTSIGQNVFSGTSSLNNITLNWNDEQIKQIATSESINRNWLNNINQSNVSISFTSASPSAVYNNLKHIGLSNVEIAFTDPNQTEYIVSSNSIIDDSDLNSGSLLININSDSMTATIASASNMQISGTAGEISSSVVLNGSNYAITAIAPSAFMNLDVLPTDFTIPSTITTIGDSAFENINTPSASIYLNWNEDNLQNMGSNIFSNANFYSLILPSDKLYSADQTQLFNISALNNMGINDLDTINVLSTDLDAKNIFVSSVNGNVSGNAVVRLLKDGTYSIWSSSNLQGQKIELSSTITKIEDNAFQSNTNLTGSFTITKNIISIGANAFDQCGITDIYLPWENENELVEATHFLNNKWLGSLNNENTNIHTPDNTKDLYISYKDSLGISKCKINGSVTPDPYPSNSDFNKTAIAIGLGLWVGIPAIAVIVTGTTYGVKKHKDINK